MSRPLGLTTLWRRHLRRRGPALLLALLCALTTAFVVAAPRLQDTAYDKGVGEAIERFPRGMRELVLTYRNPGNLQFGGDISSMPLREPVPPTGHAKVIAQTLGPASRFLRPTSISVTTDQKSLRGPGRSPTGDNRQALVRIQGGFDAHVRYDAGGPPPTATETKVLIEDDVATDYIDLKWRTPIIPVAMPASFARAWGVGVGDRFTLTDIQSRRLGTPEIIVELAGTYTAIDPRDPFWDNDRSMIDGAVYPSPEGGSIQQVTFMTSNANYGPLGSALGPMPADFVMPDQSRTAVGVIHEWRYGIEPGAMTRESLQEVLDGITALRSDVDLFGNERPTLNTGLPAIADFYNHAVTVTAALSLFPVVGLLALSGLVLGLAAYVLIARRTDALRLLRTRGAGTLQLAGLSAGEAIWWPLFAVPLAAAAVLRTVSGVSPRWSIALAVTPLLVVALVAVVTGVRAARSAGRPMPVGATGAARRVVLELFILAGAYFSVSTVRSRGDAVRAGQSDWYAALAPVLLALAVAVVVLRIYPWPVRLAAAFARRGRSLLGFVGLTGAARERGAALVPLVALVVATAIAGFLTTVTHSIGEARGLAGYREVGSDVRIDAVRVDPEEITLLAARPGVSAAVPAYREVGAQVTGVAGSGVRTATLIATDLTAYAKSVAGTPDSFTVPALPAADGGVLPAIVSAPLQADRITVKIAGELRNIKVVAVDPGLNRDSATSTAPVVALDFASLKAIQGGVQANTVFLRADRAAADALTATPPTKLSQKVVDRYALEAATRTGALPTLVRLIALLATIGALGLAALSIFVLLTLTRARREFIAVRLRTMGLPSRGSWRLGAVEVLPLVVAGVAPGLAIGLLLPRLMSDVLDLGPYTGGAARPPLLPSYAAAAAIVLATLVLAALAVAVDVRRARRTRLAEHLRAGGS